jgi:hypothetical protein
MVVFSTNLNPRDLADDAFLRRIHNKIFVEPVTAEVFDAIFNRLVSERGIPSEAGSAGFLRALCARAGFPELRACYPADICEVIQSIKTFEGESMAISRQDLERATALYFARQQDATHAQSASLDS